MKTIKKIDLPRELTALGKTSGTIGKSLQVKGIKGKPKSPRHCPISNYIFALTGTKVSITQTDVNVQVDGILTYWFSLPKTVRKFIVDFDTTPSDFEDLL